LSPLPLLMGKMFAGTLNYKLNPYITFSFEQSIYATRLADHLDLYNIAGKASNEWQDHRTEFGPIFTFSAPVRINRKWPVPFFHGTGYL
jgi:hypothetical protein